MKIPRSILGRIASLLLVVALLAAAFVGFRVYRGGKNAYRQVRHAIETGDSIGEIPASQAFSAEFLNAMFGNKPRLVEQLKAVIQKGLQDEPDLNLGEVAAMIVTYHEDEDGGVRDVAAHILGGFPLGTQKIGFHRDGFFRHTLDESVWQAGNTALSLLGRDIVRLADETVTQRHIEIFDALLGDGNIMPLVDTLEDPLLFTAVFPDPRRVVPRDLRRHVQAIVVNGKLGRDKGYVEHLILTRSERSGQYTLNILSDLKRISEITLKTKFQGVVQKKEWGDHIDPWWAYEMVKTSEDLVLQRSGSIVTVRSDFERVMVNVMLKALQRMGRDIALMRMTMDQGMDPRLADARIQSDKPGHYWTDQHRWGPNWPIPPSEEEVAEYMAKVEARKKAAEEAAAAREEAQRLRDEANTPPATAP